MGPHRRERDAVPSVTKLSSDSVSLELQQEVRDSTNPTVIPGTQGGTW